MTSPPAPRPLQSRTTRGSVLAAGLAALAAAGLGAAATAPVASAAKSCATKKGTLAKTSSGRIWHSGSSLYGCTTAYGVAPRTRRLGPWTTKTRVAFNGQDVAWTTQKKKDGKTVDRVWAGDALRGTRWLGGRQALPKAEESGARGEAKVLRLRVSDGAVGWITDGGVVVMAASGGGEEGPTRVGGGTLAGPLDDDYLRVEDVGDRAAELAGGLKLTTGGGEGDECGGVAAYELTVPSGPGDERRGASWFASYSGAPTCD